MEVFWGDLIVCLFAYYFAEEQLGFRSLRVDVTTLSAELTRNGQGSLVA